MICKQFHLNSIYHAMEQKLDYFLVNNDFFDALVTFSGADVANPKDPYGTKFRYPSYVQDIMGDIFSLGFGPFR